MHTKSPKYIPTPRAEGLLVQKVVEEAVVYDLESKEAHCLKPLAAFVFEACDGTASVAQISERARSSLGVSITEASIADIVCELEQSKLLEVPLLVMDSDGVSRRDMMRRIAFAGAAASVAGSMITTVAAPSALAATTSCTGQAQGCNCTKVVPNGNLVQVNTLCASGHCCGAGGNARCNIGCCTSSNNGQLCDCNNGTCQAVPQPVDPSTCCNGVCTPSVAGAPC